MTVQKTFFSLMIGIGLVCTGAAVFGQTQYSVADDFSLDGNPNGVWSYGYTATLGGTFALHPYSTTSQWGYGFLSAWYSGISWDDSPQILKNTSGDQQVFGTVDYLPGQAILHPGQNDEKSIARWTAPADATFEIDATFEGRDFGWGTSTDVHVLVNGVSVFDDGINGFGDTASYNDTLSLNTGDTVDFAVGFGGNIFNGDSTAIDGTITNLDSAALAITPDPLVSGQNAVFTVTNATPNEKVYFAYSVTGTGSTYIPMLNVTLDLDQPRQGGAPLTTDATGFAEWTLPIPAAAAGRTVWIQVVQFENKTNVVVSQIQ